MKRPDRKEYQSELDAWMAGYDAVLETKRKEELAKLGRPDEDGWITVTRVHRRNLNTAADGSVGVTAANPAVIRELSQNRKEPSSFADFYRFQLRQAKHDRMWCCAVHANVLITCVRFG
jgi:hypothetical protein